MQIECFAENLKIQAMCSLSALSSDVSSVLQLTLIFYTNAYL
jgi:hypothetical protein